MKKIILIGELCEDIIMHSPKSHMVLGKKIWAGDITITTGGSASYASQALAAMGENTKIFSVLGDDDSGKRILRHLSNIESIDCSCIRSISDEKTTRSIIVCDGHEKDFIGCSPMLKMDIPQVDQLEGIDLIYIAGYALYPELWNENFITLLTVARSMGIIIVLDCQLLPVDREDLAELIRFKEIIKVVDIALFAEKETINLFGSNDYTKAWEILYTYGFSKTVVFKKGAQGCVVATCGTFCTVPQFETDVYDAVGAGDIFGAAFIYGVLQQWEQIQCAKYASVYTALCLGKYEETKNYPEVSEVMNILENNRRNEQ